MSEILLKFIRFFPKSVGAMEPKAPTPTMTLKNIQAYENILKLKTKMFQSGQEKDEGKSMIKDLELCSRSKRWHFQSLHRCIQNQ